MTKKFAFAVVCSLLVVATLAEKKKEAVKEAAESKDLEQSASLGWGWGWPVHGWGWGGHSYVHRVNHYGGWGGWGGHHHGHGHHHVQQHGWGWPVHAHGWGWH